MSDKSEETIDDLLQRLSDGRGREIRADVEHIRTQLSVAADRLGELDDEIPSEPGEMTVGQFAELCEVFRHLSVVLEGHRKIAGEAMDTLRMLWMRQHGMDRKMRGGDGSGGPELFDLIAPPDDIGPPSDPGGRGTDDDSSSGSS